MNRFNFETLDDRISILNSSESASAESLAKDLELWVNLFPDLSQLYPDTSLTAHGTLGESLASKSGKLQNNLSNSLTENNSDCIPVAGNRDKLSLEERKKRNSESSARHRAKKKEKDSQLKADLDASIIEINRLKNENLELSREVTYLKRLILQIHKEI